MLWKSQQENLALPNPVPQRSFDEHPKELQMCVLLFDLSRHVLGPSPGNQVYCTQCRFIAICGYAETTDATADMVALSTMGVLVLMLLSSLQNTRLAEGLLE